MSAQPAQKKSGITYTTQQRARSTSDDTTRRLRGRGRNNIQPVDGRNKYVNAYRTSGDQEVLVKYVNPASVNNSIKTTAERNRQIFEVNNKLKTRKEAAVAADEASFNYPQTPANDSRVLYKQTTPANTSIKSSTADTVTKKIKLQIARSGTIVLNSIAFFFWVLGLYFFGVMLGGVAFELATTWVPSFIKGLVGNPGETLIIFGYMLLMLFGLLVVAGFAILYALTYRAAFTGYTGLVFMLVVALYMTPFLNVMPWFLLWSLFVLIKISAEKLLPKS